MGKQTHVTTPTLRDLYPELDDESIAAAAETLKRYVDLMARITERVVSDPESLEKLRSLTQDRGIRRMKVPSLPGSDQ